MTTNPLLKKLGFAATDRVAIVHADDIGMSQATLPAIAELFDFGLVSSAAIMVPCPWFRGAAAYAVDHPNTDFGVHLTLNAEWDSFRWGPISTRDIASGLIDETGYFYNNTEETNRNADRVALRHELDAQLARAREAGIQITHADTHMFCLGTPQLLRYYVDAALNAGTLPVFMRANSAGWQKFDLPSEGETTDYIRELEEQGLPLLDDVFMMNLDTHQGRLEEAMQGFSNLEPGFTHFILHPSIDSPELRAMAPDWRCRVADLATFKNPVLLEHARNQGIHIIGYEKLRKALPNI